MKIRSENEAAVAGATLPWKSLVRSCREEGRRVKGFRMENGQGKRGGESALRRDLGWEPDSREGREYRQGLTGIQSMALPRPRKPTHSAAGPTRQRLHSARGSRRLR
jgi:hypothetical protein